ncbi:hypothetical protein [Variovorax ginsengisoli]|uniref:Uncharacterized protein n=1 Tax=Variovorax ginsengisoli TaxID=363844 RepID=A0ABT8SG05_9BURK|nr:hypothetical protein [Variovorax ginsengisoli]MDN8618133.1 hypothetical protein [Variovorax ginsengisoli]MDO1537303.1 hypothetical protein [Variovorax ginsengisoli]
MPPFGRETLQRLGKPGSPATVAKVRATIDRLLRLNLISRVANAPVAVDELLLAEYLRRDNDAAF